MTESLFTLLFTALVLLLVRGRATATPVGAAGFGLLLTAALVVRPIAAAVLPVALARTLRVRPARRRALLAALILAPVVLGLGAWAARNHERLGSVVILTTNLGTHNAPFFGIDRARIVESGRRQGLNEAEINDALVAEIGRPPPPRHGGRGSTRSAPSTSSRSAGRGVWAILSSYVLAHAVVSDGNFRLAAPLYPLFCLFACHAIARVGAWCGWWTD